MDGFVLPVVVRRFGGNPKCSKSAIFLAARYGGRMTVIRSGIRSMFKNQWSRGISTRNSEAHSAIQNVQHQLTTDFCSPAFQNSGNNTLAGFEAMVANEFGQILVCGDQ